MNDLKPCPFCGGKARVSFRDYSFGGQNYFGDKRIKYRVQVICNKCHSRGKPVITEWLDNPKPWSHSQRNFVFAPYIEQAAKAWNERKGRKL